MHFLLKKAFQLKVSFTLLSLLLVSGCGFHLKNDNGLVEKYPQIFLQSGDPNGELARLIKRRLRGSGIELAPAPAANIATLKVDSERRLSRTISLTARAVNAEQELGYNLSYSIQSPGYQEQSFSVNLYRDFLENSAQALAKSREAELLTQELRVIAADHIIATMLRLENRKKISDE